MRGTTRRAAVLATLAGLLASSVAVAQWSNRYPKVNGYGHHVYLEGYELPLVTIGPIDVVPAPNDGRLAFASRGWLWVMDPSTGLATRVTSGAGIDARPAWSPDGKSLAFVRDDTKETWLVSVDVATGTEQLLARDTGIELDPAFSPDGRWLYYSSAVAGDLDLWRISLATGIRARLTSGRGLELQPFPLPDGERVVYVAKTGTTNEIRVRTLVGYEERVLQSGPLLSMIRIALGPDGRTLAYTWPASDYDGWELKLLDVDDPRSTIRLTSGMPLTPAFDRDGGVLFSQADTEQRMQLFRAPTTGAAPEQIAVQAWDYGTPTGRLRINTTVDGASGSVAARIAVVDSAGHPLLPDAGQARFDGQTGQVFFYSAGTVELTVPAGEVVIRAVRGLATPVVEERVQVGPGRLATAQLSLAPVWRPERTGWLAGEHHFHLNYGGPYRLAPDDLLPMARGEAMDVLTPLLANLHTRFEDQSLWGWQRLTAPPYLAFGQEIRSHFLGHLGLVGTSELFWPWVWGPGYEVYGRDDRPNSEPLAFSRRQGGLSTYVHPIGDSRPFDGPGLGRIPIELIADGVLGLFDAIEVACLWTDELGTAEAWYRLLNIGVPIAATAGTDVMNNFYRTMAIGTTRVYVRPEPGTGFRGYLAALKAGRSFVTNGPMLEFEIEGAGPGDVLPSGARAVEWTLALHSALPVDSVEIIVNGQAQARFVGLDQPGSMQYRGQLTLPEGGWVAARALGGPIDTWPAMDSYVFGHTSPIWIADRGSTEPVARRQAAADLIRGLDAAASRLRLGYRDNPTTAIDAQFTKARARLDSLVR